MSIDLPALRQQVIDRLPDVTALDITADDGDLHFAAAVGDSTCTGHVNGIPEDPAAIIAGRIHLHFRTARRRLGVTCRLLPLPADLGDRMEGIRERVVARLPESFAALSLFWSHEDPDWPRFVNEKPAMSVAVNLAVCPDRSDEFIVQSAVQSFEAMLQQLAEMEREYEALMAAVGAA